MANPSNSYANPLIQTNALSKSFQKGPPRKTCGKCGCSHSHGDCPAYGTTCSKCGRQITGPSNVEAPEGGTVQPVAHHPQEGHRIDRDAPVATSSPTKAKDEEEEETSSRDLLPKGQAVAMAEEEESPSR